jgi:hypothetical protein
VITAKHQIASGPDVGLRVVVLGSIDMAAKLGGASPGFLSPTRVIFAKRSKVNPALSLMLCVVHARRVWRKPLECGGSLRSVVVGINQWIPCYCSFFLMAGLACTVTRIPELVMLDRVQKQEKDFKRSA